MQVVAEEGGGLNVVVEGLHYPVTPAVSTDSCESLRNEEVPHTTDTIRMTISQVLIVGVGDGCHID